MAYSTDLTLVRSIDLANDSETRDILEDLSRRVASVRSEMERFRDEAMAADDLYYPSTRSKWGPDLWPDDPSVNTPGMSHVSVNTPAVYVDLPAALQAVPPVENMIATDTTDESRKAAAALERVRTAWKVADDWDLKLHMATVVKGLYSRTAARPYWDDRLKRPCVEIIERPQRLHLGYASDTYNTLEWAAYVSRMTPNAVQQAYHVSVSEVDRGGLSMPYVSIDDSSSVRSWLSPTTSDARIEVWDYWYRKYEDGKLVTYNVVTAGNAIVRGPLSYPEYEGEIPYLPLFNSYLPNTPNGRSSLYDVEPLIRQKYETITALVQQIATATSGDFWQLVGPDAPKRVPADLQPRRNEVIGPGAGNRIESIIPNITEFQGEQLLHRLDQEMETITGLNDLLLGHAPASVLGSSRAVNALIAQYELRLAMPRLILYSWIRKTWELTLKVWTHHDKDVKAIVAKGGGTLQILDPALSPRDELDTATKAANLSNALLWSQRRAMDAVGVDDPETEQQMIREEQTDATLNPAKVQVMAQLLATLQQLGIQAPGNVQQAAQGQVGSAQNDLRTALGSQTPTNDQSMQDPGQTGAMPPDGLQPGATPPAGPPSARAVPQSGAQPTAKLQTMIQNGRASGRILSQTDLRRR